MQWSVILHPAVDQDIFDIVDLICEYAGTAVAEGKLAAIERSLIALAENPYVGSLRNEIHPSIRAVPTARKGVIAF
ncbi:type II toxin-antitoxin system RelE/ParE family toxin, partial [Alphaproteobacteria bacterium]|nr:type II toxin-antitoxin system RelE/ParE family toxin [Alphaproteobacteria bacterium]